MTWQEWLDTIESRSPVAFPHPHFMAFTPLDIWARMLMSPPQYIPPRYWLRLAASLGVSSIGTAVTLPERLAFDAALRDRFAQCNGRLDHEPGALVVLGYYRSGTTHLHYLLDCDPNLFTPKWFHVSAPHGFVFSWSFLRLFMIPFLTETRPQDDVSFGPDYPAEDDFACNNWGLTSSLPGRLVVPNAWPHYRRFHDVQELTERELARWKYEQWAFLWKLTRIARKRTLLLKSPSHTARIPELLDMLGPERAKFVHIHRQPADVVRSNVKMLKRLAIFHLQPTPDDDELEERVIDEYVKTEERYLATRSQIPDGRLVELEYGDLVQHPHGVMRELYGSLDLAWSSALESNIARYLESIRSYRQNRHEEDITNSRAWKAYESRIEAIESEYKRDGAHGVRFAPIEVGAPESSAPNVGASAPPGRSACWPIAHAAAAAVVCVVAWVTLANLAHNRYDWFVWPSGLVVGYAALRGAGHQGTVRLGLVAALLTCLVLMIVAFPNTRTIYYGKVEHVAWDDLWDTTQRELTAGPTLFWSFMGLVTAYRFGSRTRVRPGGH